MGSTWSGPVAYLQKHGCPRMGIPASLEILCSCWVKFLQRQNTDIEILPDYQFFTSCCRQVLYIYDKIIGGWHILKNYIFIFLFKFENWVIPLHKMANEFINTAAWHDVALPKKWLHINSFLSNPLMLCKLALPESILSDRPLGGETSDGPHPDLGPRVELLAPHVPHTLIWHRLGFGLNVKWLHYFL